MSGKNKSSDTTQTTQHIYVVFISRYLVFFFIFCFSIMTRFPVQLQHPHSILPPPSLTVGAMFFRLYSSHFKFCLTHFQMCYLSRLSPCVLQAWRYLFCSSGVNMTSNGVQHVFIKKKVYQNKMLLYKPAVLLLNKSFNPSVFHGLLRQFDSEHCVFDQSTSQALKSHSVLSCSWWEFFSLLFSL